MIKVSVTPGRIVVGRSSQLLITFANTGGGPCANIVFTLGLPPGVRLVAGRGRVSIPTIAAGRDFVHTLAVEAERAGDYALTSPNFSYRDEDFRTVRVCDWSSPVVAEAARPEPPRVARAAPRLRVEHVEDEGRPLRVSEWGELEVLVRNPSDTPAVNISVGISGPFETTGRHLRIPELSRGRVARPRFSISPDRGGLVPVSVSLAYSYSDGLGALRQTGQEEQLSIRVDRQEDMSGRQGDKRVRTVLFLAASPRDLAPIRPDLELRKIREELQLDPNRDAFVLVDHVATRLTDISRALVRYKPDIVHFAGHGDEAGRLYVEDENGFGRPTNIDGMAELFGLSTIRCVVVNACHSQRLASAISQRIDYAIGMSSEVLDDAAIAFSVPFYQAFFGGQDVPQAFRLARSVLRADVATAPEYQVPVLYPPGPGA